MSDVTSDDLSQTQVGVPMAFLPPNCKMNITTQIDKHTALQGVGFGLLPFGAKVQLGVTSVYDPNGYSRSLKTPTSKKVTLTLKIPLTPDAIKRGTWNKNATTEPKMMAYMVEFSTSYAAAAATERRTSTTVDASTQTDERDLTTTGYASAAAASTLAFPKDVTMHSGLQRLGKTVAVSANGNTPVKNPCMHLDPSLLKSDSWDKMDIATKIDLLKKIVYGLTDAPDYIVDLALKRLIDYEEGCSSKSKRPLFEGVELRIGPVNKSTPVTKTSPTASRTVAPTAAPTVASTVAPTVAPTAAPIALETQESSATEEVNKKPEEESEKEAVAEKELIQSACNFLVDAKSKQYPSPIEETVEDVALEASGKKTPFFSSIPEDPEQNALNKRKAQMREYEGLLPINKKSRKTSTGKAIGRRRSDGLASAEDVEIPFCTAEICCKGGQPTTNMKSIERSNGGFSDFVEVGKDADGFTIYMHKTCIEMKDVASRCGSL